MILKDKSLGRKGRVYYQFERDEHDPITVIRDFESGTRLGNLKEFAVVYAELRQKYRALLYPNERKHER